MWNNKLPNNFKSSFWVYGFCAKFHLANINNTNNLNPGGAAQQLCPKPQDWYIQRRSFSEIPIPKWITKTRRITKMKNIAGKKIWEHLFKPDAVKVGIWKCKKRSCWISFCQKLKQKLQKNNHSTLVSYQVAVQNQNKEIYEIKEDTVENIMRNNKLNNVKRSFWVYGCFIW